MEARLEYQEKFAEREETLRKHQLWSHRELMLRPYTVDIPVNLADLDEPQFERLLETHKLAFEVRKAEAVQQAIQDQAIVTENVRLRELAETERQERLKQQALREVERQRAEAAENELRNKAAAEAKVRADAAEAKRKAELQPDKDKLVALAETLRSATMPQATTDAGAALFLEIALSIKQFSKWIEGKASAL